MTRAPLLCLLLPLPAACTDHTLVDPKPAPALQSEAYESVGSARWKLDILFVVDDSRSMEEEQENLARNFPAFMNELRKLPGSPDLHIGVITSDVGAGTLDGSGCTPGGRLGLLQGWDRGCGLSAGSRFIADRDYGAERNYAGELADVFACMARVGARGCGYEHPLQATRLALSAQHTPENAGFRRPDAQLQIVLITDEDDCSAPPDSHLFLMSLPEEEASFRCARAGHRCRGQAPIAGASSTPIDECRSTENGALIDVKELVASIRSLEAWPRQIFVASIVGWPADGQYRTGKSRDGRWDYLPACQSGNGEATGALRVKEFIDAFGDNGIVEDICAGDFRPALSRIGRIFVDRVPLCVPGPLVDIRPDDDGLQADCLVSERAPGSGRDTVLPRCDSGSTGPCWKLQPDPICDASGFQLIVDPRGHSRPAEGTRRTIKCRTCAHAAGDPRCKP
jgi:hypothetical protein